MAHGQALVVMTVDGVEVNARETMAVEEDGVVRWTVTGAGADQGEELVCDHPAVAAFVRELLERRRAVGVVTAGGRCGATPRA